jgi:hypothetical protein
VKIWKYEFSGQAMTWNIPQDAHILCVQVQHGRPCLWAKVNPDAPPEPRLFQIYPTGMEMGSGDFMYIDTFQVDSAFGTFVGHVFEVLSA